jgi:hypothetical protein
MASVFASLKWSGVNAEMAPEFAKDLVWEERHVALDNQYYIFGKQLHRIQRLAEKVDVVITDSPLPLSIIYSPEAPEGFHEAVWHEFNQFRNLNVFLIRRKPYHQEGRYHNFDEAVTLDDKIMALLGSENVPLVFFDGDRDGASMTVGLVLTHLATHTPEALS